MSAARDPWVMLGVSRSADDREIKQAYRRLARDMHPDRNKGDKEAAARFQDIARAYDSIRNEEARARWMIENEGARADGDFPPFPQSAEPRVEQTAEQIEIDFRQAYSGAQVEIEVTVEDVCSLCGGTGAAPGYAPRRCEICAGRGEIAVGRLTQDCSACQGRGYLVDNPCQACQHGLKSEERMVLISIPAGVQDGHKLVVPATDAARNGAADLEVVIRVIPSPVFKRNLTDPSDLIIEVPITYSEAVLGALVRIPTPAKVIELKIPPGTRSGKTFKVSGEGMPRLGSEERGDLYAQIMVSIPDSPSRKQKKLAEELAGEDDPAALRYPLFNPGAN